MKKQAFLLTLFLLVGCSFKPQSNTYSSISSMEQYQSSKEESSFLDESVSDDSSIVDSSNDESSSSSSDSSSSSGEEENEEDQSLIDHITLNKNELYLKAGKYEYLTVNFFPEIEDVDLKQGVWASDNEDIATVSQYGKVTGVSKGDAYISFTTNEGHRRARCHVFVVNSESDITKEWQKVNDMDSIKAGDTLIFGSPEFGVVASLDRVSGYLKTVNASFSSNGEELLSFDSGTGSYYVGPGEGESLTLENQEGNYLAGKNTDRGPGLLFVHDKGQKNWIFEHVDETSLDYCVNYDIDEDYWLMFNKINSGDIRFNLYNSNPTALMVMPTIFRLTIVYNIY